MGDITGSRNKGDLLKRNSAYLAVNNRSFFCVCISESNKRTSLKQQENGLLSEKLLFTPRIS